jgi:hypothetical protein
MDALNALESLGIEFVCDGLPTNETEFLSMFKAVTGSDADGDAILSDDPADFPVTWAEIQAEISALDAAAPMKALRKERDARLVETDHYALNDVTMTDEMREYRQALRDITDSYSSLDTVVWPTKP